MTDDDATNECKSVMNTTSGSLSKEEEHADGNNTNNKRGVPTDRPRIGSSAAKWEEPPTDHASSSPCLFEELIKFQRANDIAGTEPESILLRRALVPKDPPATPTRRTATPRTAPGYSPASTRTSTPPASSSVSYRKPVSRSRFRQRDSPNESTSSRKQPELPAEALPVSHEEATGL